MSQPLATPSSTTPAAAESLLRVIGTFGLAASIVNLTVGGGIFRLPASVAGSLGAAAPLAYVVCAVAMGLIVLCIADAGKRVPLTGGPYAYIGVALGPYAGFLSGVLLVMLGLFATAAVAIPSSPRRSACSSRHSTDPAGRPCYSRSPLASGRSSTCGAWLLARV